MQTKQANKRLSDRDSIESLENAPRGVIPGLLEIGIKKIRALLYTFPDEYSDRSLVLSPAEIRRLPGRTPVVTEGVIVSAFKTRTRLVFATVEGGGKKIKAIWFNQPYVIKYLKPATRVRLFGYVSDREPGAITVNEYEIEPENEFSSVGGLIARYPVPARLNKGFRRLLHRILFESDIVVNDAVPEYLRKKRNLADMLPAMRGIHFPQSPDEAADAKRRFAYEELLHVQIAARANREKFRSAESTGAIEVSGLVHRRIRNRIPFQLTSAQERVIREVLSDMAKRHPMHRLLQGDVGSGKTIVCFYAALAAVAAKFQVAVMAPSEILAQQHFSNFIRMLEGSKVRVEHLTGGITVARKAKALSAIRSGEAAIVTGTHALIERNVGFKDLGLVIIDEQHKFGVFQRRNLVEKGKCPHVLVATATPIPRTLSLVAFSDLDISVIDEMPPQRKYPETILLSKKQKKEIYSIIRSELASGRQAYFVYPIIDESEKLRQVRAATAAYEEIKAALAEHSVGLLHGRMNSAQKTLMMDRFRAGEISVLVSTQVIEVGVDVPNATVMVIENAERYGLSQLHQLRGRIVRSTFPGKCLLVADARTPEARKRLDAMVATSDGFKIADIDMEIRGPGELLGSAQSGWGTLTAEAIVRTPEIVQWAKEDADTIAPADLAAIPMITRAG